VVAVSFAVSAAISLVSAVASALRGTGVAVDSEHTLPANRAGTLTKENA
jgi:hypothetical protein